MTEPLWSDGGAVFSPDRHHRYTLWRRLGTDERRLLFVCLNPSTADESTNDPTVRRCMGFARRWGFGTLVVCNAFAMRATNPRRLRADPDPIGPDNDDNLRIEAGMADMVVAAWGTHAAHMDRHDAVRLILSEAAPVVHHLGLTKDGYPRHPLYLPGNYEPVPWPHAEA